MAVETKSHAHYEFVTGMEVRRRDQGHEDESFFVVSVRKANPGILEDSARAQLHPQVITVADGSGNVSKEVSAHGYVPRDAVPRSAE